MEFPGPGKVVPKDSEHTAAEIKMQKVTSILQPGCCAENSSVSSACLVTSPVKGLSVKPNFTKT